MMTRTTTASVAGRSVAMRRMRRRHSATQPYCSTTGCTRLLVVDPGPSCHCPICGSPALRVPQSRSPIGAHPTGSRHGLVNVGASRPGATFVSTGSCRSPAESASSNACPANVRPATPSGPDILSRAFPEWMTMGVALPDLRRARLRRDFRCVTATIRDFCLGAPARWRHGRGDDGRRRTPDAARHHPICRPEDAIGRGEELTSARAAARQFTTRTDANRIAIRLPPVTVDEAPRPHECYTARSTRPWPPSTRTARIATALKSVRRSIRRDRASSRSTTSTPWSGPSPMGRRSRPGRDALTKRDSPAEHGYTSLRGHPQGGTV